VKIGIAWYREDQWSLLRSTAADPEAIEDTYRDWLTYAVKLIEDLKQQGFDPVRVDFDVKKFNKWCKQNQKAPNSRSRSQYATHLLQTIDILSTS
jgi:hypothetical protein